MKFYDEITHCATFTSASELMQGINALSNKSVKEDSCYLTLRGLRFEDESGVKYSYASPVLIFKGLRDDFNIPVDLSKSYRRGRVFKLYLTESPKSVDIKTPTTSPVKEEIESPQLISLEESVEESTSVVESVPVETPVVEHSDVVEHSLTEDDLWKLYDENAKKDSKDKLEQTVMDNFGIDLNKRQSFENMIAEWKEAVGK